MRTIQKTYAGKKVMEGAGVRLTQVDNRIRVEIQIGLDGSSHRERDARHLRVRYLRVLNVYEETGTNAMLPERKSDGILGLVY